MPWFCASASKKKRSNKTRVSAIGGRNSVDRDRENGLRNDRPIFAIVLQNYSASLVDELSVQRGQIVEVVYTDGDWSFVRNMDAKSGHVPKSYCLSIDKVRGDFNNNVALNQSVSVPLPQPRVINVDTLQRSGSSVNSVEVHQVNSNSYGGGGGGTSSSVLTGSSNPPPLQPPPPPLPTPHTPPPSTSSSSQVIYEVPRSPNPGERINGHQHQHNPQGVAQGTTTTTSDLPGRGFEPQRAPSLPPRSANLPSAADIQRQLAHRPGFLPGCRQSHNPFSVMSQGTPAGEPSSGMSQSVLQQNSNVYSNTNSGNGGSAAAGTPSQFSRRPNLVRRGSVPPNFFLAASQSPSSAHSPHPPRGGPGETGWGGFNADSPPSTARTPGSAGFPSVAPSPTAARRVAITPGSPNPPPPPAAVTPGYATKPKFVTSPSTPGGEGAMASTRPLDVTTPNSRWPDSAANSAPSSNNRREAMRKYRRHSSDVMIDATISEDGKMAPPEAENSQQSQQQQQQPVRRLSQPCVAALGIHSPPRRPNRLQVRRTLSMQEPQRWRGANNPTMTSVMMGGASPYATPIRSSVPIHRAASYQEAVLTHDENTFGVTAGLKPSELHIRSDTAAASAAGAAGVVGPHPQPFWRGRGRSGGSSHSASTSDFEFVDHDDVFLSEVKKPYGIFQCIRAHQQKFKGEISLKKGELVIVLDYGRGEWAWAITSSNKEGLIPKSVLVRYHSNLGVDLVGGGAGVCGKEEGLQGGRRKERASTGTQTEPDGNSDEGAATTTTSTVGAAAAVVMSTSSSTTTSSSSRKNSDHQSPVICTHPHHHNHNHTPCHSHHHTHHHHPHRTSFIRPDSNSSIPATTTTDSSPASTIRPTTANRRKKKTSSVTFEPKSNPEGSQDPPKEWFDTLDSIDAAKCLPPPLTTGASLSRLPTAEQVPDDSASIAMATTVPVVGGSGLESAGSQSSTVVGGMASKSADKVAHTPISANGSLGQDCSDSPSPQDGQTATTAAAAMSMGTHSPPPPPTTPQSANIRRPSSIPQRQKSNTNSVTSGGKDDTDSLTGCVTAVSSPGGTSKPTSNRLSGIPQRKKAHSLPQTPTATETGGRSRPPLTRQDAIAKDGPIPPRRGSAIPQRRKAMSLPQTPVDLESSGGSGSGGGQWSSGNRESSIVTASKLAASSPNGNGSPRGKRQQSAIPLRRKSHSVPQTPVNSDAGGPALVRQGTVHYHDRISGRGSMSFNNNSVSPCNSPTVDTKFHHQRHQHPHLARKPSSNLLTAIKDYNPPSTAKNAIPLEKGDVLHLQPHMHYPKGWMWVWHTKRRSFGFVPKNYVAYTYDNPQSRERLRTDTVEDAV